MTWLRKNWFFLPVILIVAFAVHAGSVALIPRAVMAKALGKMSAAHGFNAIAHSPRATSASRAVVRPSPDLLYSACPFDLDALAGHVLHVHADRMPNTYWSFSVFDAETNNIFVLNDRQAKTDKADFAVVGPAQDKVPPGLVVRSPTMRGLVLVRTLINDEKNFAMIDTARRTTTCGPFRN